MDLFFLDFFGIDYTARNASDKTVFHRADAYGITGARRIFRREFCRRIFRRAFGAELGTFGNIRTRRHAGGDYALTAQYDVSGEIGQCIKDAEVTSSFWHTLAKKAG